MTKGFIQYGKRHIHFILRRKDVSTLTLTVSPEGEVTIVAPIHANEELILRRVIKRGSWIVRQQERFASFLPKPRRRVERTGQSIRYMGRQYRLRTVELLGSHRRTVTRNRSTLEVRLLDPSEEGALEREVDRWWQGMAKEVLAERFMRCLALFPRISSPGFSLRRMSKRWGSFTSTGRILLNPELLAAPVDCIDYVIIHELCHVKYPHHQKDFYQMLGTVLPDWKKRKERLERCEI